MALELLQQKSFDTQICVCSWNQKIPGSLVTGELNGDVKVWNLNSERNNDFRPLMTTKPVNGFKSILSIAIHPDGDIVAVSSTNGSVRITRISNKKEKIAIFGEPSGDDEKRKGKGKRKRKQPKDEEDELSQPQEPEYAVYQLQFNPKGTHLAGAGGVSESIKVWNDSDNVWKKNECIQHHDLPCPITEDPPNIKGINKKLIASVAWSPSGNQVACGSKGGSICVFNVPENQLLHKFNCTTMSVSSLAYSPLNQNLLVSGSHDKCIRVHDLEKGEFFELRGHLDHVLSVDVSPESKTIASGSSDRTVKLWDIETRQPITTRANHRGQVCGVKFTAMEDEEIRLATVCDARSISLYKYCSG